MTKPKAKLPTTPIEELIGQIDLSGLPEAEQKNFTDWMIENTNMQLTVETALRKGYSVKAYINRHRKRIDYAVRIEELLDQS